MPSTNPIVQQRRLSREKPAPHFRRLAATWSGLLGVPITAEQTVLMLAVLKIVREFPPYFHEEDNMEDAIGYMTLIDEIREEEGPQPPAAT